MSKLPEKSNQPIGTKDAIPTPLPKPSPVDQIAGEPVPIPIPKPADQKSAIPIVIPGPSKRKIVDYVIRGKVDTENLNKIPKEMPIRVYAVRDRKVLGSAEIKENGTFEIRYKFYTKQQKPYGVNLIVGPKLPGDQILKTKLERKFLSYKQFKKVGEKT